MKNNFEQYQFLSHFLPWMILEGKNEEFCLKKFFKKLRGRILKKTQKYV